MKRYNKTKIIQLSMALLLFIGIMAACKPEIIEPKKKSDQKVIAQLIADSTKYSEFNKLLANTMLDAFLAIRGPYTLFLPNNNAMNAYYSSKNITGANDIDVEEQKRLVFNHILLAEINANDIGLGAIRQPNALYDKIASEFVDSEILLNKTSKIIKRNIKASNGLIHEIDRVIEPLDHSLFDVLEANPAFTLFTEGLKVTGIQDTLKMMEFPYGNKMARTYFTILAVPDTIFNRYGIFTINDMIAHFTDDKNNITDIDNGFYQYMEYHCLDGAFFLSDFDTKLYPILSFNNNVLVTIDNDYKLNYSSIDSSYTGFLIEHSNVPARNGALHAINDLLLVENPEAVEIIFDTCEEFELMQGDFYRKYYKKFYDGQNSFKNIKFEGDYLQYYYKDAALSVVQNNSDALQMIGFWWIEYTTPKVMKGKYSLSGHVWDNRVCDVYVDGVKVAHIMTDDEGRIPWGDFEWTETKEHKIKLVARAYSTVFWDTVELTPIKE